MPLVYPLQCPIKNLQDFTKDYNSLADATFKIRRLEGQLEEVKKKAAKEKEDLQKQVDLSQDIIKQLEQKAYSKNDQATAQEQEPTTVTVFSPEDTQQLVGLQNCLDESMKVGQHLEDQLKAMKKDKEALEAENKELKEQVDELKSKGGKQSPTASGGKITKKMMNELVNPTVAAKIVGHIKLFMGRQAKFIHTRDRYESLAKQVWQYAKEKLDVEEKTFEEFSAVYEGAIYEGVSAHRQYIQSRTQEAVASESSAWPSCWVKS